MKYPCRSNYLIYRGHDEATCEIENGLTGEKWLTSQEAARFIRRLDGKTPPSRIRVGLDEEEKKELLEELREEGMLRTGRIMKGGFGTILVRLGVPKKGGRGIARPAACLNRVLMLVWLPVLCSGLFLVWQNFSDLAAQGAYAPSWTLPAGWLLGLLTGIVLHESAHAAAGTGYGARLFEFGVLLMYFLPGAYVSLEECKDRWKRIQVNAAGVEMNFLLAGLALLLAVWQPFLFYLFFNAAATNLLLAVSNLGFIDGTDGEKILECLLGTEHLLEDAETILNRRKRLRLIRRNGINGYAQIFVYGIVLASQMLTITMVICLALSVVG